jgi:hypothetical protein
MDGVVLLLATYGRSMASEVESQRLPARLLKPRLQSETHISITRSVCIMENHHFEEPDAGPTSSCSACEQESCHSLACDPES